MGRKFYFPSLKDLGHIVLLLSVCPSICLHKLIMKTYYVPLTKLFSYKAHIWYEGTSYRYTCGGAKVKVKYCGHTFYKMAV